MKRLLCILLPIVTLLQGCGLNEREKAIAEKEKEIAQKQEQLLLREQQLELKEKEFRERELLLDSTNWLMDSTNMYDPTLTGKWVVEMTCIETSCEGSAIGDTKNETWDISYNTDNSISVKAFSGKKLTKVYDGYYRSNVLQLGDEGMIHIALSLAAKNKLEGQREVTQKDCKIIYSLSAQKVLTN